MKRVKQLVAEFAAKHQIEYELMGPFPASKLKLDYPSRWPWSLLAGVYCHCLADDPVIYIGKAEGGLGPNVRRHMRSFFAYWPRWKFQVDADPRYRHYTGRKLATRCASMGLARDMQRSESQTSLIILKGAGAAFAAKLEKLIKLSLFTMAELSCETTQTL